MQYMVFKHISKHTLNKYVQTHLYLFAYAKYVHYNLHPVTDVRIGWAELLAKSESDLSKISKLKSDIWYIKNLF